MLEQDGVPVTLNCEVRMPDAIDFETVHAAAVNNRHTVEASRLCGCFSCETIFHAWEVADYTERDFSAICPRCQIDSILPDAVPEVRLSQSLLRQMRVQYFESSAAA
jgi:hypothetical protein